MINLPKPHVKIMEECMKFAEKSVGTSLSEYARRNQNNLDKIKLDIFRGKVAEFQVWRYLTEKARDVNPPDLGIYTKYEKSYDADLVCNGMQLHVKSHWRENNYPVSWVFQKRDKLTYAPSDKDYLCLVIMQTDFTSTLDIRHAKNVNYSPPKKASLAKTKICIYEKELPRL